VLHVVAASSERTRSLELFQLQRDEGPCLECYRTGIMVCVADLQTNAERWPQFVPAALKLGFASIHAVPMRLNDRNLGALGLFGSAVGALNDDDLSLAQALAHVASVALVTGNATSDQDRLNRQLQLALDSRVLIEQAKGAIAQYSSVTMDEAFAHLRRYARDHNEKLTEVARSVVARTLSIQAIANDARAQPTPPS
jgi:GAF domain-containing protein